MGWCRRFLNGVIHLLFHQHTLCGAYKPDSGLLHHTAIYHSIMVNNEYLLYKKF